MRLIQKILIMLVAGFISAGCTRNNGDIGDLFGDWRLDTLTADGLEMELYNGDVEVYTWAFQSNIVRIQEIFTYMDFSDYIGTWRRDGDVLILDFTHHADYGDENFSPPEDLHLVEHGVTKLDIVRLDSRKLQVSYRGEDGVEYMYFLHKVP
ncbi:MAG: lipocalin-like domain-containing protein [Duncaniella sp.]|nr:lipocalin-like domain-containing protein [Duncaniella sp.]